MADEAAPIARAVEIIRRAQFILADILRRTQGDAIAAWGLGPDECPYRIIASGDHWHLRDYGDPQAQHSLLIVSAPIKRPYIWDLAPSVSALRLCLQQPLHIHLLEWLPASHRTSHYGIDEYTLAISECITRIAGTNPGTRPVLMGHSLGGTLSAIYSASASESVCGLVLLGAPLCFQPGTSKFRDALVSLTPPDFSDADPFPGSLLSHISMLASPDTFIWSRLIDAALSVTDGRAMGIHARIGRWALDEVPLPGKLVHQIITDLYRENCLCRGTLKVGKALIGPSGLSVPTLAVVNMTDDVAPPASVKPFVEAMPTKDTQIIEYPGETGVCLQHLGILVGRKAHAEVWPTILSWIESRSLDQTIRKSAC